MTLFSYDLPQWVENNSQIWSQGVKASLESSWDVGYFPLRLRSLVLADKKNSSPHVSNRDISRNNSPKAGQQWLQSKNGQRGTEGKKLENVTLSLGRRLMVFSGLRTRRTLRDLMVLMSRPLLVLQRSPRESQDREELKRWSHYCIDKAGGRGQKLGQSILHQGDPLEISSGKTSQSLPRVYTFICMHTHACMYTHTPMYTHAEGDTGSPQRHPRTHVNQHFSLSQQPEPRCS